MRIFFTIVVPLLLPTILYLLYVFALRSRWGGQPAGEPAPEPPVPWMWLAAIGAALMLITFFAVAQLEDAPPGSHYEPARIKDGVIQPGHLE